MFRSLSSTLLVQERKKFLPPYLCAPNKDIASSFPYPLELLYLCLHLFPAILAFTLQFRCVSIVLLLQGRTQFLDVRRCLFTVVCLPPPSKDLTSVEIGVRATSQSSSHVALLNFSKSHRSYSSLRSTKVLVLISWLIRAERRREAMS